VLLVAIPGLAAQTSEIDWVGDFVIAFPQVAKGSAAGRYVETTLVISNPNASDVVVRLVHFFGTSMPDLLTLHPYETRRIDFRGEPFQQGWVQLAASKTVSAAAYISTKAEEGSPIGFARIAVLGQPVVSKALIPVFRKSGVADNTAVAVASHRPGGGAPGDPYFRLILFDDAGEKVGEKELGDGQHALFIDELFPSLPDQFTSGSLVIEQTKSVSMSVSAVGLYVKADGLTVAPTAGIDLPGLFMVKTMVSANYQQQADALASQYGFEIIGNIINQYFSARMTREVARGVGRDSRVESVTLPAVLVPQN